MLHEEIQKLFSFSNVSSLSVLIGDEERILQNCIFNDTRSIRCESFTFFYEIDETRGKFFLLLKHVEMFVWKHDVGPHNWRWEWGQDQSITYGTVFIDTEARSEIFKCLLRSLQVCAFRLNSFQSRLSIQVKLAGLEVAQKAVEFERIEKCNEMEWNDNKNWYQTTD